MAPHPMSAPDYYYLLLRTIHVGMVIGSGTLMVLRLVLAAGGRDYRTFGPLRWIPHAVDSVLLAAALGLMLSTGQYPFVQPWLSAKLIALCIYIALGVIALDPGRPRSGRLVAAGGAILVFGYIVAVALGRTPWPVSG